MKNLLYILLCLLGLNGNLFSQKIQYDFEDWITSTLYPEPDNFTTLNFQSFFSTTKPNVYQVSGVKGNALRMETTRGILDTNVVPAFITNGDIANIPYGGNPITHMPDSITGYIRCKIAPGDTGVLALFFKRVGFPVSINVIPITQDIPDYTRFSIPISPSSIAPDSVFFLITTGSLDRPKAGSWMEIDEFEFINVTEQMPNSNFEAWKEIQLTEPFEWATPNLYPTLLRTAVPVTKSSNASHGNSALQIENVKLSTFGLSNKFGYAGPGDAAFGTIVNIPFHSNSAEIKFDYSYLPVNNDTAWAVFYFHAPDQGINTIVSSNLIALTQSSNYTKFQRKLNFPKFSDSLYLEFFAGGGYFAGIGSGTPQIGSKLLIDNISVESIISSNQTVDEELAYIYPSISKDFITVHLDVSNSDIFNLEIFNVNGQKVHSDKIYFNSNELKLNTTNLTSGNYILKLENRLKKFTFVFQII